MHWRSAHFSSCSSRIILAYIYIGGGKNRQCIILIFYPGRAHGNAIQAEHMVTLALEYLCHHVDPIAFFFHLNRSCLDFILFIIQPVQCLYFLHLTQIGPGKYIFVFENNYNETGSEKNLSLCYLLLVKPTKLPMMQSL